MQNSDVSFISYFRTINQASNRDRLVKTIFIQMLYGGLFAVAAGIISRFNIIIIMVGFMAFFASIPMQWARTVKPNLTSLVPLSRKRRTVYNALCVPAMFLFSLVICGAIFAGIWLFSGLAAAAIAGNSSLILSVFAMYTEGLESVFSDGYAAAVFLSLIIFILGAGMIYAHTDNKKLRNITVVALFAFALVGAEGLLQCGMKYEPDSFVHISGYAGMYIKYMRLPWLAVLLCALTALSVLGTGIYLLILKNKPKNY